MGTELVPETSIFNQLTRLIAREDSVNILDICVEERRSITRNLTQDSLSPRRDLNPGPPEYKLGVLTTRP
jgi:hypothetical protein